MTPATACRLAGPGAYLVSRPTGVPHVYVGPLTPSGCYVPSRRRTVCRTRTRRLSVTSRSDAQQWRMRVCARCSARLASSLREPSGATSRAAWLARVAQVDVETLAVEIATAPTPTSLDHAAHLSLLVLGIKGCNAKRPHPLTPARQTTLHELVGARRALLAHPDPSVPTHEQNRDQENREIAKASRRAQLKELHDLSESRKERLGMNLAKPHPSKPRRKK